MPDWEYYPTSPPLVIGDLAVLGALVADQLRPTRRRASCARSTCAAGRLVWAWDPVPPGWQPDPPRGRALPARHAERVVAALGRSRARARVRAHRQSVARQLRRAAARHRPLRQLHGRARREDGQGASGTSRPSTTTSGTTTCRPSRSSSSTRRSAAGGPRSRSRPSSATSSCSTARPARRSIRSRSGRCRRTARPARRSRRPSRSRPTRRRCTRPSSRAENMFGFTPWDTRSCREQLARYRYDGTFTPPTLEGSIQYPATLGGMNWGGVALDPERGMMIANQIAPRDRDEARAARGVRRDAGGRGRSIPRRPTRCAARPTA